MSKFIRKVFLVSVITILALGISSAAFTQEIKRTVVIDPGFGWEKASEWPRDAAPLDDYVSHSIFWLRAHMISIFEYLHPTIKVEPAVTGALSWDQMLTQLAGGTAPCMYPILGGEVISWAKQGLVMDITDYIEKDWDTTGYKNFPSYVWGQCMYKGKYYALPMYKIGGGVMSYRKDWFKEAGIFNAKGIAAPPDNWNREDDMLNIAIKITDPKKKRWGFVIKGGPNAGSFLKGVVGGFFGSGNLLVRPDPTGKYTFRAAFDLPEIMPALEFYRKAIKSGCALYGPTILSERSMHIYTQQTAMYALSWSSAIGLQMTAAKAVGDVYGMAPIPLGVYDYHGGGIGVDVIGINPTISKEKADATWEWIKFAEYGAGKMMAAMEGYGTDRQNYTLYSWMRMIGFPDYPGSEAIAIEKKEILDKIKKSPAPPGMNAFGLSIENARRMYLELNAVTSAIQSNPDIDIMKELEKCAKIVNNQVLNYKEERDIEKFKAYYTACKDFYEKNNPEFYKNFYSKIFEKYYKVW